MCLHAQALCSAVALQVGACLNATAAMGALECLHDTAGVGAHRCGRGCGPRAAGLSQDGYRHCNVTQDMTIVHCVGSWK